jgi:glutamate racemase
VEDGWTTGPVPEAVAGRYLDKLAAKGVDTLVLGCTHYPLLRGVIARVMGPNVRLVDSAKETAKAVSVTLTDRAMLRSGTGPGRREYLASDAPESFARVGARMLGARAPLAQVEWVDV